MTGVRLPDWYKLAVNWKNGNGAAPQFSDMMQSSNFFWRCFISLVKFSYWSKFHVNIITGSGVMTIFFYKGLTRNPEIGNTPVWVLPNIWRLGRVRDTKFGTNVSNEMLLNAAKCQGYNFDRFRVIKRKTLEWGKVTPPHLPTPRLGIIWKKNSSWVETHIIKFIIFSQSLKW